MASTVSLYNYTNCCSPKTLEPFKSSIFVSSKSVLKLKGYSSLGFKKLRSRKYDVVPVVIAAQSNFIKGDLIELFNYKVVYYDFYLSNFNVKWKLFLVCVCVSLLY